MSKLADKLQRLLALATLREGEADDESRVNEARTAAVLLLQTCQREGVRIRFLLPKAEKVAPAKPPPPPPAPPTHDVDYVWQARYGKPEPQSEVHVRTQGGRRAGVDFNDFADYLHDMADHARRDAQNRADQARREKEVRDAAERGERAAGRPWPPPPPFQYPPRRTRPYDGNDYRRTKDVYEGRVEERFYTEGDPEEFFTRARVVRVLCGRAGLTCRKCGAAIAPGSWMWALLKRDGTYSPRFGHEACGHEAVTDGAVAR